ncbi:hypothetical protein IWQ60_011959 [Tieghemiomyces parasiticus]|uniref:Uncharacterized protein n=1 Tax=Tieghemiomyces parasiticus TaxID=78921 RepID=A0A9W7ZIP4_9FUNG|nr:hypothetical protein IWQ60_011959 [Tieghemiomyces parasiticus]
MKIGLAIVGLAALNLSTQAVSIPHPSMVDTTGDGVESPPFVPIEPEAGAFYDYSGRNNEYAPAGNHATTNEGATTAFGNDATNRDYEDANLKHEEKSPVGNVFTFKGESEQMIDCMMLKDSTTINQDAYPFTGPVREQDITTQTDRWLIEQFRDARKAQANYDDFEYRPEYFTIWVPPQGSDEMPVVTPTAMQREAISLRCIEMGVRPTYITYPYYYKDNIISDRIIQTMEKCFPGSMRAKETPKELFYSVPPPPLY